MLIKAASKLAVHGGKPAITEPLRCFNTIGYDEAQVASEAVMTKPLSGYLGGERKGGYYVERLEEAWADMFGVKHAIACNSATSGILIACMAIGVKGKTVRTTPYTMSGTVAPAALLGANVIFGDIDEDTFCLKPALEAKHITISVNLFGHPGNLHPGCFVIEDAAQSILSTRDGKRCDADITVFSGNIHKAVHCGEGGMCCTNDDHIADNMRLARNHWELNGPSLGLNLRLTEVQAAIWYVQLMKAEQIVARRREIAEELTAAATDFQLGTPPIVRSNCVHSYYVWAFKCPPNTNWVAKALLAEGLPVKLGYVIPLYKLAAFQQPIHRKTVEHVEHCLITYENCGYDPTDEQLKQIWQAFEKVSDANRQS